MLYVLIDCHEKASPKGGVVNVCVCVGKPSLPAGQQWDGQELHRLLNPKNMRKLTLRSGWRQEGDPSPSCLVY